MPGGAPDALVIPDAARVGAAASGAARSWATMATPALSTLRVARAAPVASAGGHASPSGPAFTVVLLVHVAAALVGMIALVSATVSARRLLTAATGELPRSVRTYFSPGVNWAGRALYAVPAAGAGLIALSGGKDRWGDDWVVAGLVLWAVAAAVAEARVWPAERRVQAALAADGPAAPAGPVQIAATALGAAEGLWRWSMVVLGLLVAATVVMFARP